MEKHFFLLPPRHPTNAGAPHPPPPPTPRQPLQHRPRRRRPHPPQKPPRPKHQPAPPAPSAAPARMAAASAAGGRGAAPAPQAQGLQGEPARGAEGARPWDWERDAVPDPLGGKALPLVVEVYGWLSWACSGTTRGMRNRPFDTVLLRRYQGNQEVPPGGVGGPRGPRAGPPGGDLGGAA